MSQVIKVMIAPDGYATDGTDLLFYIDQYGDSFSASVGSSYFAIKTRTRYLVFREKIEAKVTTKSKVKFIDADLTQFKFLSIGVDTLGGVKDVMGGQNQYVPFIVEPAALDITINCVVAHAETHFLVPRFVVNGVPQYHNGKPKYYEISVPPPNYNPPQQGWEIQNYYWPDWSGHYYHKIDVGYIYYYPYWPANYYGASISFSKPYTANNVWGPNPITTVDFAGSWCGNYPDLWPIEHPREATCTVLPVGVFYP